MARLHWACVVAAAVTISGCASGPLWEVKEPEAKSAEAPAAVETPQPSEPPAEAETQETVEASAPPPPPPPEPQRSTQLLAAIAIYDDGKHRAAARALRAALATPLSRHDQVQAHKYLAFVECSLGRRTACREQFRRALKIDPAFDLEPAEAGHPVWGPIFKRLKHQKPRR